MVGLKGEWMENRGLGQVQEARERPLYPTANLFGSALAPPPQVRFIIHRILIELLTPRVESHDITSGDAGSSRNPDLGPGVSTSRTTYVRRPLTILIHVDYFTSPTRHDAESIPSTSANRYNPANVESTSHVAQHQSVASYANGSSVPANTASTYGKHARDEADEQQQEPKKSRVEGEEDSQANGTFTAHESEDDMEVDEDTSLHPGRISKKRVASAEDDEVIEVSRDSKRGKRARKVSHEKQSVAHEYAMDDDGMDTEEALDEFIPRGKKRDHAEVSSTLGGDDLLADEDGEKSHRHRKRRTVSHKKPAAAAAARGQKRSRDVDSVDSDGEESGRPVSKSARKRRSKRDSDAGSVHGDFSQDPLCKGRRIGEEWEINGVRYKVGLNGQRLRQELVKKSRSKFPMVSTVGFVSTLFIITVSIDSPAIPNIRTVIPISMSM